MLYLHYSDEELKEYNQARKLLGLKPIIIVRANGQSNETVSSIEPVSQNKSKQELIDEYNSILEEYADKHKTNKNKQVDSPSVKKTKKKSYKNGNNANIQLLLEINKSKYENILKKNKISKTLKKAKLVETDKIIDAVNGVKQITGSSFYERIISSILKDYKINFKEQYTFSDLKYNKSLRIDFMLLYRKKPILAIEYNGMQHYKRVKMWQTEEEFKELQIRDKMKKEYLENKGIDLVVIPYNKSSNIMEYITTAIEMYYKKISKS